MTGNTLCKDERLHGRDTVSRLFEGKSLSLSAFPLRAVCLVSDAIAGEPPVRMLVSVPKRLLHHAVGRNRVKRQVREAFRCHKRSLAGIAVAEGLTVSVAFIWIDGNLHSSARVARSVNSLLTRIGERVAAKSGSVSTAAAKTAEEGDGHAIG